MSGSTFKVLFVCLGNICRSPAGENVLRTLAEQRGIRSLEVDSAGTANYHRGKCPDPRMIEALQRRGMPATGRARVFEPLDFDRFDWIITMDQENRSEVLSRSIQKALRQKVRGLMEFCSHHAGLDVPDPYYGGEEDFERVLDIVEDGCAGVLEALNSRDYSLFPNLKR